MVMTQPPPREQMAREQKQRLARTEEPPPAPTAMGDAGSSDFDITKIARPNILALQPYRCARE